MGRMGKPEPAERGHAGLCGGVCLILRTTGHHRRGLSAPDKTQFMFLKGHSSFLCRMDHTEARKTEMGPCKRWGTLTKAREWPWGDRSNRTMDGPRHGVGQITFPLH